MPIYAIFEEHDNGYDDYSNRDIDNVLIGYVEDVDIAERLCDMTEQIAKHDAEEKIYDDWCNRNYEWREKNRHRYVDAKQIIVYVKKRERLLNKINEIPKPDLSKVPKDRHHIVMGGYFNKTHALTVEIMDIAEKIKASIDIEKANAINAALDAERTAAIGPMPNHPNVVYKKHYELIEKLA